MSYLSEHPIYVVPAADNKSAIGNTRMHQPANKHIVSVDSHGKPVHSWTVYLLLTLVVIAIVIVGGLLKRADRNLKK